MAWGSSCESIRVDVLCEASAAGGREIKDIVRRWLVACGIVSAVAPACAQPPVVAPAIDERQGDQYGWALDSEAADAARAAALRECGAGYSVVLTFARCGTYAADQDADSTAVGWAESYDSAAGARRAALSKCSARGGGSDCIVRAYAVESFLQMPHQDSLDASLLPAGQDVDTPRNVLDTTALDYKYAPAGP